MDKKKAKAKPSLEGFVCPSCQSATYEAVTIPTAFTPEHETGVYRCSRCGFGFLDPARYVKPKARSAR
jgi:DNA-directed RNA polymerase subunit M/transcription elongation factor TFIIS